MMALKNTGLISNTRGQANACLIRAADQIIMLDIYRANERDYASGHHYHEKLEKSLQVLEQTHQFQFFK